MAKARLQMLKPRLQELACRNLPTIKGNPGATPRMRGRKWVERRASWLRG